MSERMSFAAADTTDDGGSDSGSNGASTPPPLNLSGKVTPQKMKRNKRVNFNLTLDLHSPDADDSDAKRARRVPQFQTELSSATGSEIDETIPTTPGGRLQVSDRGACLKSLISQYPS